MCDVKDFKGLVCCAFIEVGKWKNSHIHARCRDDIVRAFVQLGCTYIQNRPATDGVCGSENGVFRRLSGI